MEYKHGVVRNEEEYELQLCAQAMCLEEMFGTVIHEGSVFYTDSHRRVSVELNPEMRALVRAGADALHHMLSDFCCPPVEKSPKCRKCSMKDLCMPGVSGSAVKYINELVAVSERGFDKTED